MDAEGRFRIELRRRKRALTGVLFGVVFPAMAGGVYLVGPAVAASGGSGGLPLDSPRTLGGALLLVAGAMAGVAAQLVYARCPGCSASVWKPGSAQWPETCPGCGAPLA